MQYRKLGTAGVEVSALGLGCMRLPALDNVTSSANINEPAAIELIHQAINGGINYLDTAYVYHQERSEEVVGKALAGGYRDKVQLATKLPLGMVKEQADFDRVLNTSLLRLGTDHIDFYLFHGIGASLWKKMCDLELLECAEKAKADGRIGNICFSFHGEYEAYEQIINGYDHWDMAQVMYNYMDIENQAGAKGVELAASKGIGVVAMEPLRGGKLAKPIPAVEAFLKEEGYSSSFVELALRFVWDTPQIGVAISGMTTLEQLNENLSFAERALAGGLSSEEHQLIKKIRGIYAAQEGIPCTDCGYCMPCEYGVKIPFAFELYNEKLIYGIEEESRRVYNLWSKGPAEGCIECGECEPKCPQDIPISEWMPKIDAELSEK